MAIGPFISYAPPGTYTRTLAENNASNVVPGLRIPVIIGVGQEELETLDLELVRGSSSYVDTAVTAEDVSEEWVVDATNPQNLILGVQDGTRTQFRVRNFPIVKGDGLGQVTNDVRNVIVTVNGTSVAIGAVQGSKGLVTLQVATQPDDIVRCSYQFHRGDTSFTDTVSDQVTTASAALITPGFEPYNITAGTSDTFVLTVNGAQATLALLPNSASTAASLKSQIDAAGVPGLSTSIFVDNQGLNHLQFTASVSLVVGAGNANGPFGFTSNTSTARNATFKVFQRPIVDGTGGGITTTDPSKVVVKVNGIQVLATAVDGTNGLVTLGAPPAPGSSVTIQYAANTWQDTYDQLPNTLVTTVIRCGIAAGRSDYIQGQDFVIANPSLDTSIINWGTSYTVSNTKATPGATAFGSTQVVPTLVDQQMFLAQCTAVTDTSVVPAVVSTTDFLLPEIPTVGNGRNTTLGASTFASVTNGRIDLPSNRPDLVKVWAGRNLRDALNRGQLTVTAVDGPNRKITLKDAIAPDETVFATFYYNNVSDDTFLLTCLTPGPVGQGQFSLFSALRNKNLNQVRLGTKSGFSQTIQWPRGVETIPDAFHTGAGTPVSETVTVTFGTAAAENAVYTTKGASPWSFYAGTSSTWVTKVNGSNVTTNLAVAHRGYLVSGHVPVSGGGTITIPASPNNVLNLSIDGTNVAVAVTAGARTPAQIVSDLNAAIDLVVPFAPGPNNLASFVQVGGPTGDVMFVIKSFSTPGALPGGFDAASYVRIMQGTVEGTLGFATYARADGTSGAINKPATLLGTLAGPFNITAGLNDTLKVRVNGVDYAITLPSGAAVATSAVVLAINAVPGLTSLANAGTLANLDQLRLTSSTNNPQSSLVILDGNANVVLGFTQGDQASQTLVSVQEVADALMATGSFASGAVAYADTISGNTFLTIESLTTGAATSSIGFVSSTNSAFNQLSGTKIVPGTDGDNGEDARDNFTVTSSNASGSAGTGFPGQTYTDAVTGLRFTVLPSATGSYTASGYFTLVVSQTFDVSPSIPTYSVPGLEMTVSNTVGVGVNDVAAVQTFNPGGLEPKVGDFYYVSYRYMKQDFSTRIFQQLKTIEANFGPTSAENRATLGAYLSILNGSILVGISQVKKAANTNQATAQVFNQAIADLTKPLPGNVLPDIVVPLSTDTSVYAFLTNHCEIQSSIRNQAERMGFIGFASGTTPTSAQSIAKSLGSNRIVAFYPDTAVITLTDELGQSFEQAVDGTFFAAAAAGAVVSPAVDVATPYTRRRLVGFTRIPRVLDPVESNQTAVAGVSILDDLGGGTIRIRHGLTTQMDNVLTRLPTVTQISDFVQQQSRATLDSFVGTKFLASRTNEVEVSMTGLLKSLIQAEIIGAFTGVVASVDPNDPTILNFNAYYQPIFPLLYIVLTFNLRASLR
jgi:hypothetical protein